MRSYQTLSLVGCILGMIITFGVLATLGALNITIQTFQNATKNSGLAQNTTEQQRQNQENIKRKADSEMLTRNGAAAIMLYIVGIIVPFVIMDRTKIVGIILLPISFITLVLIGLFGVIGFALLLTAGIVALRYKPQQTA
jgi:hypothetical protein